MNELLQTERTYVADLKCVIEVKTVSLTLLRPRELNFYSHRAHPFPVVGRQPLEYNRKFVQSPSHTQSLKACRHALWFQLSKHVETCCLWYCLLCCLKEAL